MPDELLSLASEFGKPPFSRYKGWEFEFEYPGFFVYYHSQIPYRVYFTPDWDEPGEVSIQIMDAGQEYVDGQLVPFLSGKAADLYAIITQWLEYVEQKVRYRGVMEWHPDRQPWSPRSG